MSSIHNVITGDTFDSISRKSYGTEVEAGRIARANPGAQEPLTPGTSLIIPVLPNAPQNVAQSAVSSNINEVAVLISGTRFRFWENMQLTQSMDAIDTIQLSAPFDADAPGFRETFRPFSFPPLDVTIGGTQRFKGTMVGVDPLLENERKTLAISGYSLPGVLGDCTPPASAFPLEYNGQTLEGIANSLLGPFGLASEFRASPGTAFGRVASVASKKIFSFLSELATQRNLVIASTPEGKLLFWQSIEPGQPVARLQQGASPILSVLPNFNPQNYYSHITGLAPVFVGGDGPRYTVKNPHLLNVVRPLNFEVRDTDKADVKAAAEAKAGRMFGNMSLYSVQVVTWRTPAGELWEPNTTVTLLAPDAMIYTEYEFLIRSVTFDKNATSETATLNLTLPGAFSGKIPETLPWD